MADTLYAPAQKNKYLTEMDHYVFRKNVGHDVHIHGCMVRIPVPDSDKLKHKFFSIGKSTYRSMRAAKNAARDWRDAELVKRWGKRQARKLLSVISNQPTKLGARKPKSKPGSRNRMFESGIVGVHAVLSKHIANKQNGWAASWTKDEYIPKRKMSANGRKVFSFKGYKEDIAFLNAAIERAMHVPKLIVYSVESMPVTIRRLNVWLTRNGLPKCQVNK